MRIQHNIPAMSSYRNYINNTSAVAKNLEKLSSGYKINRAGDDAAGLAISEKMRAQITGLEVAQKNAKDGISLVQTAEGALTEVHDMLNRMYELAEQSANGTYSDDVDREQLQKEIESLKSEVNRIADSSNFNGIKLLDGSLDGGKASATYNTLDTNSVKGMMLPYKPGADRTDAGTNTVLETDASDTSAGFKVSLNGLTNVLTTDTGATDKSITLTINGTDIAMKESELVTNLGRSCEAGETISSEDIAMAFVTQMGGAWTNSGNTYDVSADGDTLVFTAKDNLDTDTNRHYDVSVTGVAQTPVAAVADKYTTGVAANGGTITNSEELSFNVNYIDSDGNAQSAVVKYTIDNTADTDLEHLGANVAKALNGNEALSKLFTASYDSTAKTFSFESKVAGATVKVNGFDVLDGGTTTDFSVAAGDTETEGADGYVNGTAGYVNVGNQVITMSSEASIDQLASTTLNLKGKLTDGAQLTLGDQTYTIALGEDSKFKSAENVVYMADANAKEEDIASKLSEVAANNTTFTVGHEANKAQITLKQLAQVKDSTDMSTMDKMASYIGYGSVDTSKEVTQGKALTLQIGDTAEDFNKLTVNVANCHAAAMGIGDIDISTQDGASTAMDAIKSAINYVSDVRGGLGALQNRLDHTINNLGVQQENIQDAESTIRDVDVAKEMMEYTKNNILVQSAQAMLAQANQLPQGVLQLLG